MMMGGQQLGFVYLWGDHVRVAAKINKCTTIYHLQLFTTR